MVLSVEVLPAPLAPITVTSSPPRTSSDTPLSASTFPGEEVAHPEVQAIQHHGVHPLPVGPPTRTRPLCLPSWRRRDRQAAPER